ncbi:MAG: glycosyltransferase family 4 protein [Pirellulaceae bacterium]
MATRLIYLTAGAGGMYCGSCLHDNALAKAMARAGWDVQLVPFYTPIRTDESDVSVDRIFFGGINVYLQQKIPLFRHLPKWLDGFLDNPRFIRRVTSKAIETDASTLGDMALSMLRGEKGNQRKEVKRVVDWLADENPDIILSSNLLITGFAPTLKRIANIPIVVTLQGDDVFLNQLPEKDRAACLAQIRENNQSIDFFLTHSEAFRQQMSRYFDIPLERIVVTPLGIDTHDFRNLTLTTRSQSQLRRIGYFARLAPEKGLHHLVEAFIELKRAPEYSDVRLRIAGWLSPEMNKYADEQFQRLRDAGLESQFQYEGVLSREDKLSFLQDIDLLCVPTEHEEPKGLFALEAMASGTPVVLPDKGALTELVEQSGGGIVYSAHNDANENRKRLVNALKILLDDEAKRKELGANARHFVLEQRDEVHMAQNTMDALTANISGL